MADILKGQHQYNKMAALQYVEGETPVKMQETINTPSCDARSTCFTSPRVNARDSKLILQR
jgi:hypothetical protein